MALRLNMFSYIILAVVLHLPMLTNAAAVTVFLVQPPFPGAGGSPMTTQPPQTRSGYSADLAATVIASAIGPAESGLTKYEVQIIQSHLIIYRPETTQTVVSVPRTAIYTIEQGAGNILHENGDPSHTTIPGGSLDVIGMDFDCVLDDGKKTGVCKGANLYAEVTEVVSGTKTFLSTRTQTEPTTFTGTVYPLATLDVKSGAHPGPVPVKSFVAVLAAVVFGGFIAV